MGALMNQIVLIIFYFGPFPNYFFQFLNSCGKNPEIDWRIYTDNEKQGIWPKNVSYIHMAWAECQELFQSKFSFPIQLRDPKKLCDFKPAYGYILEETLSEYAFWGHCDLDLIFGELKPFLRKEQLQYYDKLYTLGHFTLYRNDKLVNRCFMSEINGRIRYKEVYQTSKQIAFDEWGNENINEIFLQSEFRFLDEEFGADIWPEYTCFILSHYDKVYKQYICERGKWCFFRVIEGKVICYYMYNNKICSREYPYVHMQKRKFFIGIDKIENMSYDIVPGKFEPCGKNIEQIMENVSRKYLIDWQFIRIKWRNIKERVRTRNFKFVRKKSKVFK